MRFVDKEIQIKIFDPGKGTSGESRYFKAYLEKNDITVQLSKMTIPALSYLVGEPEQLTRPLYTLDLVFNVIAEDRDEAIENFEKMHFIYDLAKPVVYFNSAADWQNKNNPQSFPLTYKGYNTAGKDEAKVELDVNYRFEITLKAFARIGSSRNTDSYAVLPNNISCTPIYEMGYIQVPYWAGAKNQQKLYVQNSMNMIPIGYKVGINAKIVLRYDDAIIDKTQKEFKKGVAPLSGGEAKITKVRLATAAFAGASVGVDTAVAFYDAAVEWSTSNLSDLEIGKNFSATAEPKQRVVLTQLNRLVSAGILKQTGSSFEVVSGNEKALETAINQIKAAVK